MIDIVVYLDGLYPVGHASRQAKVNALREDPHRPSCSAGGLPPPAAGLRSVPEAKRSGRQEGVALMPSILDKAFRGNVLSTDVEMHPKYNCTITRGGSNVRSGNHASEGP